MGFDAAGTRLRHVNAREKAMLLFFRPHGTDLCCLEEFDVAHVSDPSHVFGFALFGLGDGRDEFSPATRTYDFLCGLPRFIQLPMLTGVVIGRVEDGFFEKEVAHRALLYFLEMN